MNAIAPYLRLIRFDKPIGTALTALPALTSLAIISNDISTFGSIAPIFITGAFFARSAGCITNDIWDQKLDKMVDRTQERPLASGQLSNKQALAALSVTGIGGLGCLSLLNQPTALLGAASIGLVALYPAMKRVTWWPQAFLGLTFNWGALMASTAVTGSIQPYAIPFYLGSACWTMYYDTIYAFQDISDDKRIGVKSSAQAISDNPKKYLKLFSRGATGLWIASGVFAGITNPFYFMGVGYSYVLMERLTRKLVFDSNMVDDPAFSQQYGKAFVENQNIGLFLLSGAFGSLLFDSIIRDGKS